MRVWLKREREANGMTQADMAKRLDISEGYYSLIENGMRQAKMDVALAIKIAKALGLAVETVVAEEAEQ